MPRSNREWSALDREVMRMVFDARDAMESPPSLRALAARLGVSAPRVMDLRDASNGKPTVDEFCELCGAVGLDPANTLREAMRRVGRG